MPSPQIQQTTIKLAGIPELSFSMTHTLMDVALASARIHTLKLPHSYIRPQLHCILAGGIGTGKSSVLSTLCKSIGTEPIAHVTTASIMGSIDKESHRPILPAIWDCRNSVLPIDELNIDSHDYHAKTFIENLLGVMESGRYSKRIATRCEDYKEEDDDLSITYKSGKINVNTRFVLIATTMHPVWEPQRVMAFEAFRSRCIVIPFLTTMEDLRSFSVGKNQYKPKRLDVRSDVVITKKQYARIRAAVEMADLPRSVYLRTIGDVARIYAITGWKTPLIHYIIDLRRMTV